MKRSRIPLFVGVGVAVLAVAVLALVDALRQGLHRETLRTEVAGSESELRARLEAGIHARLLLSQGLVTHVSLHPEIAAADFEVFARKLVESQPEIEVVALMRDTTVIAIYPREPYRKIIGYDIALIPAQRDAILLAQKTRQPVLDGPVDLVEGGRSLILRIPVYLPGDDLRATGRYIGMVNLLIDPQEFCTEALVNERSAGLRLGLSCAGGDAAARRQIYGDPAIWEANPVLTDVQMPGSTWQLAATPAGGWEVTAPNTWLWRAGGLLLAVLTGVFAGLRSAAPERLRQAVAHATEALKESEDRLKLMFSQSPDFINMLDTDGRIQFSNRTNNGKPPESNIGLSIFDFAPPEEAPRLRESLKQVSEKGEIVTFETRYVDPQQNEFWFRNRLAPIRREGRPLSILAISTDITSRVKSERELRESEERFRRAFNESPMGMVMVALNYRILSANAAFCQMMGYTPEEITRISLSTISPADEFEQDRRNIAASLEPGRGVVRRVKRYLRKDGGLVWCNLTGTLIRDSQEQPLYMVGMVEDITSRRQAEAALQAAEARNRAILNAIPDIIQRVDRQGRYLDFKTGGEKSRFVDPDTALQKTVHDFFPPETAARFMGIVHKTLDSGQLQQFEITLEKDNLAIDYDVRVAVCGADEVLVLVRNISAQKRAREVLHAILEATSHTVGADFLRTLVRILANTLHVRFAFIAEFLDPQGVHARMDVFWVDDRFLEPFDYLRAGTPCERLASGQVVHIARDLRGQFPRAERLHALGAESYLAVPLHDQEGAICGVMGIMHDQPLDPEPTALSVLKIFATRASVELQRKQVEEALRESEERFRRLSEASFEGVVIHEKGVVLDANQVFAQMFGFAGVDEVIGKKVLDFAVPECRAEVMRRIETGDERPYEAEGIRRDGSRFFGELLPREIPLHGRRVRVTAMRDITDRKRSEAERRALELQVQHSQKLESLGIMAGGIAHDFNNLLTGILGHASLAQLDLPENTPTRQAIQQIELASRRAADLTNQLLAYSGKGRFVVQAIDLSRLVREMAQLLEVSIPKKITLAFDFPPDLPPVEADATQIQQVVMNLITNAADAIGQQRGTITIRTGREVVPADYVPESFLDKNLTPGEYACLEVVDTGCGMEDATLARIFDPFFTTKFTGRGLGLAAVLGIVRGHRGALRVHSRPEIGTTFRVVLPFAAKVETGARPKAKTDRFFIGQGTVLIVDDEESVRTVARLMLQKFGFRVLIARDGREGVEVFTQHADEINVVLLDMTMPQMSGEEAYREMAKLRPQVAVILSSGYSEQETVSRFGLTGLAGFIQKPYRTMELVQAVQAALNRA